MHLIGLLAFVAEFEQLPDAEKQPFCKCKQCGEIVDMWKLDVLFHEDHVPRPDIQYAGLNGLNQGDERTSLADVARRERTGSSR